MCRGCIEAITPSAANRGEILGPDRLDVLDPVTKMLAGAAAREARLAPSALLDPSTADRAGSP